MLAKKNENIKEAYEILQKVSKSKDARMAYEARQAEIMDQLTREETAKEEGRGEGRDEERKLIIIKQHSKGLSIEYIADINEFDVEYVRDVVKNNILKTNNKKVMS